MKYLRFTYVDQKTKLSYQTEASFNGSMFPEVIGLQYVFALESAYPTNVPHFFGTCPDDSDTKVEGVLAVLTQLEWEAWQMFEMGTRPSAPANIKKARNDELAKTDWTQLADSSADKAAWALYRQALRDLPQQSSFPDQITWPIKPGAPT